MKNFHVLPSLMISLLAARPVPAQVVNIAVPESPHSFGPRQVGVPRALVCTPRRAPGATEWGILIFFVSGRLRLAFFEQNNVN